MNTKLSVLKALVLVMLVLGSVFGNIPMTFAQNTEVETNHPCPTAQDFGAVALPFTLDGSLDSTSESPDVDFFSSSCGSRVSTRLTIKNASSIRQRRR